MKKTIAILLCLVFGHVCGELERDKFEKAKLRVNEEVFEDASPDEAKKPNSQDNNLQGKYAIINSFVQIPASAKDAVLFEKETFKNPLTIVATSTVKSSSVKAKNSLEIMYSEKPAKHFKVLRKIAQPKNSRLNAAETISIDSLESFLRDRDAVSREETNHARTRQIFFSRRKRMAQEKDPTDVYESFKAHSKIHEKFSAPLRLRLWKTDETEEKLIDSYATTKSDPSKLIGDYKAAKAKERKQLQQEIAAAGSRAKKIIDTYKALRKGKPWNYLRLRLKFKAFFAKPSTALKDYEALKRDELESIDSFLDEAMKAKRKKAEKLRDEEEENSMKKKPEETKAKATDKAKAEGEEMDRALKAIATKNAKVEDEEMDTAPKAKATKEAEIEEEEMDKRPEAERKNADDSENVKDSYDKYFTLLKKFSESLKFQLMKTDVAENKMLFGYSESEYPPKHLLDNYYVERKKEIELLKQELAEAGLTEQEVHTAYKALRKGTIWNFIKNANKARREYFKKPSAGLSEYEALKRNELDIDLYLNGSLKLEDHAPERPELATSNETKKSWAYEVGKARMEDSDRTETVLQKDEDPKTKDSSHAVMTAIVSRLPDELVDKIIVTDQAEEKLLESYAKHNKAKDSVIADYIQAKTKERETLKEILKVMGAGASDIIANYKALRKGKVWNYIKLQPQFKAFFEKPSAALNEYESIKRDELAPFDSPLNGQSQSIVAKSNYETKAEVDSGLVRARANVFGRARAKGDEEAEEMKRGVRAKDIQTVEFETPVDRENVEDKATTDVTKGGDLYIHGSPDNVTSAGVMNTETTRNTKAKDNSNLLRFAILFGVAMQVIIAIIILAPQSDKLAKWCKRMKRTEATSARGETNPYVRKKRSMLLERPRRFQSLLSTSP